MAVLCYEIQELGKLHHFTSCSLPQRVTIMLLNASIEQLVISAQDAVASSRHRIICQTNIVWYVDICRPWRPNTSAELPTSQLAWASKQNTARCPCEFSKRNCGTADVKCVKDLVRTRKRRIFHHFSLSANGAIRLLGARRCWWGPHSFDATLLASVAWKICCPLLLRLKDLKDWAEIVKT